MARRNQLEAAVTNFFESALNAQDITAINIAAGEALQQTLSHRSIKRMLWIAVVAILLSDLIPIGPLDLGLLPDLHIFQWILGRPYAHNAAVALYHVKPESPHVLGATLPWGSLF